MKKKISILGCGWLGLPLAQKLQAMGWSVNGSTTKPDKLNILAAAGIKPFLINLRDTDLIINPDFFDSEILFINVPPGRNSTEPGLFLQEMDRLIQQIEDSAIREVIFISSTSVYPDVEADLVSTQEVIPDHLLVRAENRFLENAGFRTSIIRFGGLIGPKRFPGRFLSGKSNLPSPLAPVNLIHLDDCVGIIEKMLAEGLFGGVYHACAPDHPSKKTFYEMAADVAGLPLPHFADNDLKKGKTINPAKLMADLNYQFKHPDLLAWLRQFRPEA